jgi:glucose/arabinose dehydrogenase
VFAYLTTGQDNRVVTMRFDGNGLTAPTPSLIGIPAGSIHDGGRIAFGPDGKLYVATGEIGSPILSQDHSSSGGKILRINPDGSIPADNPDPASSAWSLGHPNIQGVAWDSGGRRGRQPASGALGVLSARNRSARMCTNGVSSCGI